MKNIPFSSRPNVRLDQSKHPPQTKNPYIVLTAVDRDLPKILQRPETYYPNVVAPRIAAVCRSGKDCS